MALQGSRIISLIVLANLLAWCQLSVAASAPSVPSAPSYPSTSFNRSSFPASFVFGGASSAYQYEGAVNEDGRGPSIWDTFTHEFPEKILDGSNGDVANDFYHRYKEDIKLMKFIGLDAFRFSISWSRVLPKGKLSKGVNKAGIAFYNNLINALLAKGITPFATIFHWDLPQALEDEYGGFLSHKIVDDFRDFSELCFKEFGDRVKYWSTFNEPWTFTTGGYDSGVFAPGRCSAWMNRNCTGGDSGTEPYLVAHHMILSHASTVKLYRKKYKAKQKGEIGIVLVTNYMYPYNSKSKADVKAAQRGLDFMYGWFVDPITYGDYPKSMRTLVGNRLPKFTDEQSAMLKNSYDFLGLNYYTSNYARDTPASNGVNLSYTTDSQASLIFQNSKGQLIGAPTGASTFFVYPQGLYDLLVYTKERYKNPPIYITENGMADANNGTAAQLIRDTQRVDFYVRHLLAVKKAIKDGVHMKGYFAWSFLDTWEWNSGFTMRFGINFVDYNNGLKRIPKLSGLWFKNFLK